MDIMEPDDDRLFPQVAKNTNQTRLTFSSGIGLGGRSERKRSAEKILQVEVGFTGNGDPVVKSGEKEGILEGGSNGVG